MKAERPFNIVLMTEAGNEPVREWLKDLPKEDCKVIGTDILTAQYAWPVGKPLVDNLGDGGWEDIHRLGDRLARTLFAVVDEEIVLLHGFIKQQRHAAANWNWQKNVKNNFCKIYEQKKSSGW